MSLPFRPLPRVHDPPLAALGLVGDGRSAALVHSDGSVVWWCPQRFDAPSVFASLLDAERGGRYVLGCPEAHRVELHYVDGTNVLRGVIVTRRGRARVTTVMPYEEARHSAAVSGSILRLVECLEGELDLTVDLEPAFDYARDEARIEVDGFVATARAASGMDALRLSATAELSARDAGAGATFRMRRGDAHAFVLAHDGRGAPASVADPEATVRDAIERELSFWPAWLSRCRYDGAYDGAVRRSLLALKLLQYVPTGAFVAAPTMGLPEIEGGDQNWDYRYAWIRDGSFIVMAFETTGFDDEALRFRRWLSGIIERDAPDRLQTLYRVDGARDVPETPLRHLRGYRASRPVFLGNKAVEQRQLDTYGEAMMCFHRAPRILDERGETLWPALRDMVDAVCDTWDGPDAGIWEIRSEHEQHVHSKAMAWLALHHGLRIAEERGYVAPADRWTRAAHAIRARVDRDGWSRARGAYKESFGSDTPDASLLLLPLFGFDDATDERTVGTVDRLIHELSGHRRLHRQFSESRGGREGAFLPASLWLAQVLAHLGREAEARAYVDATLSAAGPLGLLPEEAEPVSGTALGNHPQALTHLSLVLTAYALGHPEAGRRLTLPPSPSTRASGARAGGREAQD